MQKKRNIEIVMNFVTYKDAELTDNLYYANLTAEELLKECFELRKLNYFAGEENSLPRIEKVGHMIKRKNHEKQPA